MSVEGGPSGAISVGSVPAVSVGSSLGSFGPRMESVNSLPGIVNEGSVKGGLEDMVTIAKFEPVGEIIFNRGLPSVIEQAENIVATVWERNEPLINTPIEQGDVGYNQSRPRPIVPILPGTDLIQIERTKVALEKAGLVSLSKNITNPLQPQTEAGPDSIGVGAVSMQTLNLPGPHPQEQAEQIAEVEELTTENQAQNVLDGLNEEEVEEILARYIEDEGVSEERRVELKQAIRLARAEAAKEGIEEIEGWRIVKHLPSEHEGVRSQIVKKTGPDGSLEETVEEIASRKFKSMEDAIKEADLIVSEKQPVKIGKIGQAVGFEAVARIFKRHIVKRYAAKEVIGVEITKKRHLKVLQQNSNRVLHEETQQTTETKVGDYNPELAEALLAKTA